MSRFYVEQFESEQEMLDCLSNELPETAIVVNVFIKGGAYNVLLEDGE